MRRRGCNIVQAMCGHELGERMLPAGPARKHVIWVEIEEIIVVIDFILGVSGVVHCSRKLGPPYCF
jgi:hypothetical protein